jgi:molybdopterin-containing oxidoreductase family iron-sulfur binding subunit
MMLFLSEALDAFEAVYGERLWLITIFKASLIVSVGADFLAIGKVVDDSGYAKGRIPQNRKMSRHFQLEANMTLSQVR